MTSGGQDAKVIGTLDGDGGIGVYGSNTATSGWTFGTMGKVHSPQGTGTYGEALAADSLSDTSTTSTEEGAAGTNVVSFRDDTPTSADDVEPQSHDEYPAVGDNAVGVYGRSPGDLSYGVAGSSLVDPANEVGFTNPFGVYGQTDESSATNELPGYGLAGYNSSKSGVAYGVAGRTDSPDGAGLLALNAGGGPAIVSEGLLVATERSISNSGVSVRQSNVQTVSNGTYEIVDFDTKVYDDRGSYDLSNNKYVAPAGGRYQITLSVGIQAAVSCRVDLLVNNTVKAADMREGSDELFGLLDLGVNPTLTKTVELTQGDEVVPYVRHYSTDPEDTATGERWTYMTIEQVA